MGPVVTRAQQAAAFDGIGKIAKEAQVLTGGASAPSIDGIDPAKSAFVAPTLMRVADGASADAVHDTEVFGPAATIVPYKTEGEAFALVARGGGSLVASVYGDDRAFFGTRRRASLGPRMAGC